MTVAIIGAGAFGTALAVSIARGGQNITLWARRGAEEMQRTRQNERRLPGVELPKNVSVTGDLASIEAQTLLLSIPMQTLGSFLEENAAHMYGRTLVACCKGVDLQSLTGPVSLIRQHCPDVTPAILTGPSFATDIARGLPTALTLACQGEAGESLQHQISAPNLRLYLTDDTIGAELGGALKNVVAIACGIAIGAGLGESARAAIMTRGYAEMQRMAVARGARAETLSGLSGFGDLTLTCTSTQSRNYRYGLALGSGESFAGDVTVEGAATAKAVSELAKKTLIDMPIATTIARVISSESTVEDAIEALLSRPLKKE